MAFYKYNGEWFSASKLAAYLNVPRSDFLKFLSSSHLQKNPDVTALADDYVSSHIASHQPSTYIYNGESHTASEIASLSGLGREYIGKLLRNVSPGTDVTSLCSKRRNKQYLYNGKLSTMHEIADLSTLSYGAVCAALTDVPSGSDVTDILSQALHKPPKPIDPAPLFLYHGCVVTEADILNLYHLYPQELHTRLSHLSPAEDFPLVSGYPDISRLVDRLRRVYCYRGEYLSLHQVADRTGIRYEYVVKTLNKRFRYGEDITEAIDGESTPSET